MAAVVAAGWFLLLTAGVAIESASILDASRFCESYVECASVALLEERLCLGNSRKRPYWLPESHDPHKCHDKLKNDYTILERMEEELDNALLACLTENSQPLSSNQRQTCSSDVLLDTPKFSFGRTISFVPTKCFTGVDARRERECKTVRECCGTYDRCSSILTESAMAKSLEETRQTMRQRAKDCELGKATEPLPMPSAYSRSNDVEESWAPTGHVNVKVSDLESIKKKNREQQSEGELGNVNVRFSTAEETAETHALKVLLRAEDDGSFSGKIGVSSSSGENSLQTTEQKRPALNFPQSGIPISLKEHNEKFDLAMKNAMKFKESTADIANEGLDSLMGAARVSKIGIPSGHMKKVETFGDSEEELDLVAGGEVVTSRPLILVVQQPKRQPTTGEGCKAFGTKTAKIEKILGMLGEKEDSRDMAEIKALINDWHNNFRKRLLSAKDRSKSKEIMGELEKLVKHFDEVNLKLIKSQVEAGFSSEEYPTEDSEITGNECDPLPLKEGKEANSEGEEGGEQSDLLELVTENNSTTLIDEHNGEHIVVDDGLTKILLPGRNEIEGSFHLDNTTEESFTNFVNEEYKKEMERFRNERLVNLTSPSRNDTTCDAYMRCRAQMHLAVDGCAWRFASGDVLSSLAESAESLLYRDEGPCDPKQQPLYEQLYEMLIRRNTKLRTCLDKKNEKFFEDSVCVPFDEHAGKTYDSSLKRILSNEYKEAIACYHDANRIQEKCTLLRECCPNFDECREETIDIELEQTIISATARINEGKQQCIRERARDAFKQTLRDLLGGKDSVLSKIRRGQLGLDISRGARLLRAK